MGLDWCLKDKTVDGQEHNLAFAEAHCERINKEIDNAYESYLEEVGAERPNFFPNEITEKFRETPEFIKLHMELSRWVLVRETATISPLQTIGCPAIGVDEEATEWARNYYNEIKEEFEASKRQGKPSKSHENFLRKFRTVQDYIEENKGMYVAQLAKNKEGLGSVTGIAVGPESFRGKVLRFMTWLDPDLVDESYENHDPPELEDYGQRLLEAAKEREADLSNPSEEELEELTVLKDAAAWCIFWGKNGHAMHAWY